MKTEYIFNGTTPVNPIDRKKVFIEVNYDNGAIINQAYPQVGIKNLEFAREDVKLFKDWLQNNTEGIFYAPTLNINLSKGAATYTVPLYLDLSDGLQLSADRTQSALKLYMSLDWLNDIIDAWTYESVVNMASNSSITNALIQAAAIIINSRTFYIPYIISTVPNYVQAFSGLLTILSCCYMLQKEITDMGSLLAQIAGIFTTVPAIIGFVAELIFAAAMIASIVVAIEAFVFSIIQNVKYHAAIMLGDLLEAGCTLLGLSFESSIFQQFPLNQVALMPEKYIPVANGSSQNFSIFGMFNANFIQGGYTTPNPGEQQGYPIATIGDMFRLAKKFINGKIILQNPDTNPAVTKPTLVFERRDFVPNLPTYQLPDIRNDFSGFNTKEFSATTIIKFAKDLNDKNTFDYYQGQIFSSVAQPLTMPDPLLSLTKGLREIQIDAARGIRKETLTFPEQFIGAFISTLNTTINFFIDTINAVIALCNDIVSAVNDILSIINDILHVFGGSVGTIPPIPSIPLLSTANPYLGRLGMLLMEHDLVNVPKLLLMEHPLSQMPTITATDGSQVKYSNLHPLNSSIINALYCWNAFYLIDSFVPYNWGAGYANPTYSDQQGNGYSTPVITNADMTKHNQYTLWALTNNKPGEKNKVSLGFQDFNLMANNNTLTDMNGDTCIIDTLGWHFEETYMDLEYRKNELYTENLYLTNTLPNGQ